MGNKDSAIITSLRLRSGPLPSASGACGQTSGRRQFSILFTKFVTKMKKTVYEVVIDGVVYRGSLEYIKQVIKEDRENRD